MLIVRWLNGTLDEYRAPLTVKQLEDQIPLERNQLVHFVRPDENEVLAPDVVLQPNDMVNALIVPEREMRPFESDRVTNMIHNHFRPFQGLVNLLKESGALIAGGSILSMLCNLDVNDFDVYVHHSRAKPLVQTLVKTFSFNIQGNKVHKGSAYCRSFFRRNRILARIALQHLGRQVDVIVVDDAVPLIDVVTNFDLSFCETWWDGSKVFATDPHGVRNKEGCLKPSYRSALFQDLNPFIIRRIRKYRKRGFTVHLTHDSSVSLAELLVQNEEDGEDGEDGEEEKKKNQDEDDQIDHLEDWAVRRFLLHVETALQIDDYTFSRVTNQGRLKAAFFFHAYPATSRVTYDQLVALPCFSDPVALGHLVTDMLTRRWIASLPVPSRDALLRTFRVSHEEWEIMKRRSQVSFDTLHNCLKTIRDGMMTEW